MEYKIKPSIAVLYPEKAYREKANQLANDLSLDQVKEINNQYEMYFIFQEQGLGLFDPSLAEKPIFINFDDLNYERRSMKGKSELIARAVGFPKLTHIIDATAGLAKDAYALAKLGCQVTAVERSPFVYALIKEALNREDQRYEATERLSIYCDDAKNYLKQVSAPEVIYLDPMYPEKKKNALAKKEMRIFRKLVGDDQDIDALFSLSLEFAQKRVVVKRPLHAESLQKVPDVVLKGKTVRYDIYLKA